MQGLRSTMLMQGSPAVTRTLHTGDEGFHNAVVSKEEGSLPSTYDIVMVSLSGSLLLLVAVSAAISILRRHFTLNYSSKDLSTSMVVENTTVTNHSSDKIPTVNLNGPVCLSYISDTRTVSPESAISEGMISISELPFFSFALSVKPSSPAPEQ